MRLKQNDHCLADYIFICILLNENVWISIRISLKLINITALVQIMACCREEDKPLSEPMMVSLLTLLFCDICVTMRKVKLIGLSLICNWYDVFFFIRVLYNTNKYQVYQGGYQFNFQNVYFHTISVGMVTYWTIHKIRICRGLWARHSLNAQKVMQHTIIFIARVH